MRDEADWSDWSDSSKGSRKQPKLQQTPKFICRTIALMDYFGYFCNR